MFREYVKIKRLGHEDNKDIFANETDTIYIESKMDGANVRFGIINGELHYGTRHIDLTNKVRGIKKPWQEFIDFVLSIKDKIPPDYIFYMEYMIPHTIKYDWDRIPKFLGFDVYSIKENKFLVPELAKEMFEQLGIAFVPLISIDYAGNLVKKPLDESMIPQSLYYDGKDEGIVLKNYDKQIFAKIVREQFKELNMEVFGHRKKKNKASFDEKFADMFATEARINKIIHKLWKERGVLSMSLMKELIPAVWDDIWEEEWQTIKDLKGIYNFKCLKSSIIPERCRLALTKMMRKRSMGLVDESDS